MPLRKRAHNVHTALGPASSFPPCPAPPCRSGGRARCRPARGPADRAGRGLTGPRRRGRRGARPRAG
jgi:hypothetical protein